VRIGVRHEGLVDHEDMLKAEYDLFRVTTNLILFRETGVLELNLASIPYMGSPEGLRHF